MPRQMKADEVGETTRSCFRRAKTEVLEAQRIISLSTTSPDLLKLSNRHFDGVVERLEDLERLVKQSIVGTLHKKEQIQEDAGREVDRLKRLQRRERRKVTHG